MLVTKILEIPKYRVKTIIIIVVKKVARYIYTYSRRLLAELDTWNQWAQFVFHCIDYRNVFYKQKRYEVQQKQTTRQVRTTKYGKKHKFCFF